MCAEIIGCGDQGATSNGLFRGYYKVRILNPGLVREYCNWETFHAQCRAGQVILMESAKYGRMKFGRCIRKAMDPDTKTMHEIGCSEDIIK